LSFYIFCSRVIQVGLQIDNYCYAITSNGGYFFNATGSQTDFTNNTIGVIMIMYFVASQ
jgi:hypothetical protein